LPNLFRLYLKTTQNELYQDEKSINLCEDWKFQVTKEIYYKSLSFHPYFHGRLYINHHGKITNSYNDIIPIGNIDDLTSKNIINTMITEKFWNTNRDKIDNCKKCEFRYCCIDNTLINKSNEVSILQKRCKYESVS